MHFAKLFVKLHKIFCNMATSDNWVCTERFEYASAAKKLAEKRRIEEGKMAFVKTVDKENRCVKYRYVKPGYKQKEGETMHYGRI